MSFNDKAYYAYLSHVNSMHNGLFDPKCDECQKLIFALRKETSETKRNKVRHENNKLEVLIKQEPEEYSLKYFSRTGFDEIDLAKIFLIKQAYTIPFISYMCHISIKSVMSANSFLIQRGMYDEYPLDTFNDYSLYRNTLNYIRRLIQNKKHTLNDFKNILHPFELKVFEENNFDVDKTIQQTRYVNNINWPHSHYDASELVLLKKYILKENSNIDEEFLLHNTLLDNTDIAYFEKNIKQLDKAIEYYSLANLFTIDNNLLYYRGSLMPNQSELRYLLNYYICQVNYVERNNVKINHILHTNPFTSRQRPKMSLLDLIDKVKSESMKYINKDHTELKLLSAEAEAKSSQPSLLSLASDISSDSKAQVIKNDIDFNAKRQHKHKDIEAVHNEEYYRQHRDSSSDTNTLHYGKMYFDFKSHKHVKDNNVSVNNNLEEKQITNSNLAVTKNVNSNSKVKQNTINKKKNNTISKLQYNLLNLTSNGILIIAQN